MTVETIAALNGNVNSPAMYSFAYYSQMDRKTLLKQLIDDRFGGNQADFARAIKRQPAQVNQWLTGYRALGDAGALPLDRAQTEVWDDWQATYHRYARQKCRR